MAKIKLTGHASGSGIIEVTAPNTSTNRTITLPDATATLATNENFTSTGIDDNADATSITIDSSEGVGIKNTVSNSMYYKGLAVGNGTTGDQGITIYNTTWGALAFADSTSGDGRYEGSVSYNHSNNSMHLATNHATAISIDSSGRVTKPLQPYFNANAAATNIPLTTQTTVTLNERIDTGSNLASNIFTAPITGKYLFTYMIYFASLDSAHTALDCTMVTSNKVYQQSWKPSILLSGDGAFSVSGSQICDMDASDTMYIRCYVASGTAQTDIHTDSTASGILLA